MEKRGRVSFLPPRPISRKKSSAWLPGAPVVDFFAGIQGWPTVEARGHLSDTPPPLPTLHLPSGPLEGVGRHG